MVLFELNKIIKDKYIKYKKNNTNKISYKKFKSNGLKIFSKIFKFYFSNVNVNYIQNILNSNKISIICYCIDDKFDIKNITSILIYNKVNISKYYILLLGTHERFRNYGYGKLMLDEFILFVKNNKNDINIKIIVKSLLKSLNFYLSYGFITNNITSNKLFLYYDI